MAYLPGGSYRICEPIKIPSGSDYWFSGAGYATDITLHPGGNESRRVNAQVNGGPAWVPPPSPATMSHIELDAAGSIGARVSGLYFTRNKWLDPLTNITHDVCSLRVSKTGVWPTFRVSPLLYHPLFLSLSLSFLVLSFFLSLKHTPLHYLLVTLVEYVDTNVEYSGRLHTSSALSTTNHAHDACDTIFGTCSDRTRRTRSSRTTLGCVARLAFLRWRVQRECMWCPGDYSCPMAARGFYI